MTLHHYDQLSEQQGYQRGEFDEALDRRARAVKTEMENSKFPPLALLESVRQLVVSGNYLLYVPTVPRRSHADTDWIGTSLPETPPETC